MKRITICFVFALHCWTLSAQQNVGIGTTTPHTSAILDITSTAKGLLIPRMTGAQRAAIPSPAFGLLVIQTNAEAAPPSSAGLYLYEQSGVTGAWRRIARTDEISPSSWAISGNNQYSNVAGNVGIGTTSPSSSAALDVSGTTKGLLMPRMTTVQRNAIASPATGLMVFDTDLAAFHFYNGTVWSPISGDWTLNGSNMYSNNAGNVGVGVGTPTQKLHILGNTLVQNGTLSIRDDFGTLFFINDANAAKASLQLRSTGDFKMSTIAGNATGKLIFETQSSSRITVTPDGNVGIGTVAPAEKLVVAGNTLISAGGILSVAKASGLKTVEIKPTESGTDGASILLYNRSGVVTIEMDADYGDGDGRVITSELQINGGSDLAENFDISDDEDKYLKPGMLVSIDTENEGSLCITRQSSDKKIVGVISGANGIKPGMLMGQQGTIAFGKYPVALAGRVYVLCNTEGGEINAGDFLTSSSQRGYAKKAGDLNQAQGAIIGKAMGKADSKTGYVLVLINLQ